MVVPRPTSIKEWYSQECHWLLSEFPQVTADQAHDYCINSYLHFAGSFVVDQENVEDIVFTDEVLETLRSRVLWEKIYRKRIDRRSERRRVDLLKKNLVPTMQTETMVDHALNIDLENAIEMLDCEYRNIVYQWYFHGMTYKEIGQEIGMNPQTVSQKLRAAKRLLKIMFRDRVSD